MSVNHGNSENGDRARGPSGLPLPGPAPSTSDLRRRATAFFDREMGPAEVLEFQATIADDPRAFAEFDLTKRALDRLRTGRPCPDFTASILDETERRRRLLGTHRHTRRRALLRGLARTAAGIAFLAAVYLGVESILPPLPGRPVASGRATPSSVLTAVPPVPTTPASRDALAMEIRTPVDATQGLRWDMTGTPLVVGAPADVRRAVFPIESWQPAGPSGLWPGLYPNASVTRPPMASVFDTGPGPARAGDKKDKAAKDEPPAKRDKADQPAPQRERDPR